MKELKLIHIKIDMNVENSTQKLNDFILSKTDCDRWNYSHADGILTLTVPYTTSDFTLSTIGEVIEHVDTIG